MHLIKTFIFLTFIFTYSFVFSQKSKTTKHELFLKKIKKLSTSERNFNKTIHFFSLQNWDSVLVYSSKALVFNKNKRLLNYCHYMRGYGFMKKKLFNEAQKEYGLISNDFIFYYKIIRNLGGIAIEQRKFKKAVKYFNTLNNLSKDSVYDFKKSSVIHDLGISYFHLSKFKKAEEFLLKSLSLQKEEKDTVLLIGSYMDVANVYYEQYKDDLAIPYYKKAYQLSKKTNSFSAKRKASLNMAIVEENRKNLTKALVYRKEFEKWKDSLNNQQKIWGIAQIEKRLAITQKQKEINFLESENKVKILERNSFILFSFLLLLILLAGVYIYSQQKKATKIITFQKEELNNLNKTKDKLFSIVSHDLRSSVNLLQKSNSTLLHQIQVRNYDALDKIVTKNAAIANSSYNLLENLLHWATIQTKQLYFYIESVDLFSAMQQIAFNYQPLFENKEIIFKNKITPASFILADLDSLKIIIRNLLDNSIKFNKMEGFISVYNYPKGNNYECFVVEDSGIGMSAEIIKELLKKTSLLSKKNNQEDIGTGLGIQLCKTLILKNHATLEIESTINKGTKMIITFPKSI
ncbi:tetratricopeptide repeat-containing sensor histidine kinase [Tenacibaculum ovolyticum]|uniref:tetratricopeptide repeat-containing sensor histidine kinase n=1 Tax=Tenacibaculum ovolyticum TaxID=104270 RepID=UPI0007ECE7AB|nr:tetratricopeptide repeat-containing sensor histidine kinase [Tenacibaculum ovolyticum]